jgi:hypothetical protein
VETYWEEKQKEIVCFGQCLRTGNRLCLSQIDKTGSDTDTGNIEQADSEPDKKVISNQERR